MSNSWRAGVVAMGAALAVSLQSPAWPVEERPSPAGRADKPPLDARSLAISDSKRSYCAKLVPSREGEFEAKAKLLERGTSRDALASLRASGQYKSAYDAEAAFLQSVPPENGRRIVCAQGTPSGK